MLSMVFFISGGEIFIILLAILIFFGADKIPEFTRLMGKGVREFRKATDDIKREFQENSSGVLNDIKSIGSDLSDNFTKDVSAPIQKSASEATKTFEEYQDQFDTDYYYDNQDNIGSHGNEYHTEELAQPSDNTANSAYDTSDSALATETTEVEPNTGSVTQAAV